MGAKIRIILKGGLGDDGNRMVFGIWRHLIVVYVEMSGFGVERFNCHSLDP